MIIFLVVFGAICAFFMAFGTGANDAANSVGPCVGAGAISIKNALIMASIFELVGGVFIGQYVSLTIRKGIVDPMTFADTPIDFAIGMLSALFGASVWLVIATWWAIPVSTTHSIVGGIIGFAIVARDINALNWPVVGNIALSWVVSPATGFAAAWLVFKIIQKTILRKEHPRDYAFIHAPIHFGVTIMIMAIFLIESAMKALKLDLELWLTLVIGTSCGLVSYLTTKYQVVPAFKKREEKRQRKLKAQNDQAEMEAKPQEKDGEVITLETLQVHDQMTSEERLVDIIHTYIQHARSDVDDDVLSISTTSSYNTTADDFSEHDQWPTIVAANETEEGFTSNLDEFHVEIDDPSHTHHKKRKGLTEKELKDHDGTESDTNTDISETGSETPLKNAKTQNRLAGDSPDNKSDAEKEAKKKQLHDFNTEVAKLGRQAAVPLFFFLQNLAAAFVALGHGANNIPNSTGPLASILGVWETDSVGATYSLPLWIFVAASVALDMGLLMFGKRVLLTIGEKVTLLTPTGGYAAQLSTSITTIVCSRLGMPISTTHVLIGAVIGVGVAREGRKALNLKMILKIVISWLVTLPISAITAICLYLVIDASK